MKEPAGPARLVDTLPGSSFPVDDYTPYGYLDLPGHTRRLRPLGVLRSWEAGFRWHVPAYAGGYGGRRETYRAGARLVLDGIAVLADLAEATSPYHSRGLLAQVLRTPDGAIRVEHHAVGEHAFRSVVTEVDGSIGRLTLHIAYERLLGAAGEWGETGLVGRPLDGLLVLQGFEDGEAVVLWAADGPVRPGVSPVVGITADENEAMTWVRTGAPGIPSSGFVTALGDREDRVRMHAVVELAASSGSAEWIMARGRTLADARTNLERARASAASERARITASDDGFWSMAPRLTGDWPAHWRRGLVYDLETIRMMVRPPIGIYRHAWDGMQLQSPRVVLAETAMDALVLAWADPVLAQELLLGTFLDAPEPNVPCSREDGSYNMVAADGTVCGTSPAWGYPILVASVLDAMHPGGDWVERLYPPLARFVRWWLAERRDPAGFAVYACSWESGQDLSPRFGDQPLGGGHPIGHVRAVDLEAALAHGCDVLAGFAERLGLDGEASVWRTEAAAASGRLAQLWDGSHWVDVDAISGASTGVDDVMLAAPLALGVALADQRARATAGSWLGSLVEEAPVWPMFAWTAVEALRAADRPDAAGALAVAVIDRAYGFRDARPADPALPLPGICAEYWPEHGQGGGEGYGWGAFTTHLLLSTILGIRHSPDGVTLAPWLPEAWRRPGSAYGLDITLRGRRHQVRLHPDGRAGFEVEVDGVRSGGRWARPIVVAVGPPGGGR
ncbi:MAG: hypothetical protein ABWZ82_11310 [Candidatus Limnocylindrales bacterium]